MQSKKSVKRNPLLRMVKRDDLSKRKSFLIRLLAILGALVAGGLLILCLGKNPILAYKDMVKGAFGSKVLIQQTIKQMVPLLITAIGISFAFKMKFWNIGAEGQVLVGAIGAGYWAFFYAAILPKVPLVLLMMITGMVMAGLYGLLPALCKAKWGTNETLFTLMLNYIALYFVKFLANGPWKAKGSSFPKMPMIHQGVRLTKIFGVHWGWILALVLVVVSYIYFTKTKQGYEIAVVGESNNTAKYAGIDVGKVFKRTMFLSGALAGLAGVLQVAGSDYTITETTAGGVGFTAITVAWLAKMNPYGMLGVAAFIAVLERGCNQIETTMAIPSSVSKLLVGIILFFMLGSEFFINYRLVHASKKEV